MLLLLAMACARQPDRAAVTDSAPSADSAAISPMVPDSVVLQLRAGEVLDAIKRRDGPRLAAMVHPRKGARFSPYSYVHADSDVVIARSAVATLFTDTLARTWGHADGSGEPITLPFAGYYRRFVYDVDFAAAPQRRVNGAPIRAGNLPSNLKEVYPGAQWVEYHFPGFDVQYGGMDWRSLWLVLEQVGADWFLVGVVHGSWTI
jgi:hypothetical protein